MKKNERIDRSHKESCIFAHILKKATPVQPAPTGFHAAFTVIFTNKLFGLKGLRRPLRKAVPIPFPSTDALPY
jgi:hypothetical protein